MNPSEKTKLFNKIKVHIDQAANLVTDDISTRHDYRFDVILRCVNQVLQDMNEMGKEDLMKLFNKSPVDHMYDANGNLTPQERYPRDFPADEPPGISYVKQAERILAEESPDDFDERDWTHYKNSSIRKYRNRWLREIVDQTIEEEEDLKPIHRKALDNNITSVDLNAQTRYNVRINYLDMEVHRLINDLIFDIYKTNDPAPAIRMNRIRKLHELYTDLRVIKRGSEDQAWKRINESWGIDRGLE